MIITISDVYGPRGGNQPMEEGNGYRAIYPVPEGVTADNLQDLAGYLQLVVDPHRVRGVNIDGTKLEIIVEAASGGKITSTRALYDALKNALSAYVAGQPAPVDGGTTQTGSLDLKPLLIVGGLVALLMFLSR